MQSSQNALAQRSPRLDPERGMCIEGRKVVPKDARGWRLSAVVPSLVAHFMMNGYYAMITVVSSTGGDLSLA
jgi:hypothetical protein